MDEAVNYEQTKQAVFFDFDGILFSEANAWMALKPTVGRLGTGMKWSRAYESFLNILKTHPESQVDELFRLDNYNAPSGELNRDCNIMPMDSVIQTARSHIYRNRKIYIISAYKLPGRKTFMEEIQNQYKRPPRPGEFPNPEDPFDGVETLVIPQSIEKPIRSKEESLDLKLKLITDRLAKWKEGGIYTTSGFDKAFLYFTEPEYREKIDDYIVRTRELLPDGRNAIVPFYMAHVDSVNLT